MNTTITLRDYLNKGKTFVIPNYQRGYVWGKIRVNETDSVSYLMNTIANGFKSMQSIFLQGVTVSELCNEIIIIDGQQRTTCLFLLLRYLGYDDKFEIKYEIRKESSEYLKSIKPDESEQEDEKFQDIYFFKKSMRIIRESLSDCDREKLKLFVLDRIKFLYINIPDQSQAVKVFTMMNGHKAHMKTEEIIKAELLRLASSGQHSNPSENEKDYSYEWSNNMLRSRYAREWDKWLHWWNQDQVKQLFRCNNIMGCLIKTFYNNPTKEVTFESFKAKYLNTNDTQKAKEVFDRLRRLQKRFEDAFNDPISYNQIGAILRILDSVNRIEFIQSYFNEDVLRFHLGTYYRCVFLEMTHKEIMSYILNNNTISYDDKFETTLNALNDDFAYINNIESVFRLLLRLNIDQDCKQNQNNDIKGRKFDFSIWDCGVRSLEHIHPKSKVWHKNNNGLFNGNNDPVQDVDIETDPGYISRESICFCLQDKSVLSTTEHSIGNLVLLYKNENSAFGASLFEKKKTLFFDPEIKEYFNSRHLLHTIYAFSKSEWNGAAIAENKYKTIKSFKEYYGKQD